MFRPSYFVLLVDIYCNKKDRHPKNGQSALRKAYNVIRSRKRHHISRVSIDSVNFNCNISVVCYYTHVTLCVIDSVWSLMIPNAVLYGLKPCRYRAYQSYNRIRRYILHLVCNRVVTRVPFFYRAYPFRFRSLEF